MTGFCAAELNTVGFVVCFTFTFFIGIFSLSLLWRFVVQLQRPPASDELENPTHGVGALLFSVSCFSLRCLLEMVWLLLFFAGRQKAALIVRGIDMPFVACAGWSVVFYLTILLQSSFQTSKYKVSRTRLFFYQEMFTFSCFCWGMNTVLWLYGVVSPWIGIPLVICNTFWCCSFILSLYIEFIKRLFALIRPETTRVKQFANELSTMRITRTEMVDMEVVYSLTEREALIEALRDLSMMDPSVRRLFKLATKFNVVAASMFFSSCAIAGAFAFMFQAKRDSNCSAIGSVLGTYAMGGFCFSGGLVYRRYSDVYSVLCDTCDIRVRLVALRRVTGTD